MSNSATTVSVSLSGSNSPAFASSRILNAIISTTGVGSLILATKALDHERQRLRLPDPEPVGRGGHESFCILLADPQSDDSATRLQAMVRTSDGFELAEVDLELRGEGSLLAARQSGIPDLRHARLSRHRRLAQQARREAQAFLDADPGLESAEAQLMAIEARRMFGDEVDWLTRA